MGRNSKKEENAADSPSEYNQDIAKLHELAEKLKQKYSLHNYDLIDIIMKRRLEKPLDSIPISVFDNNELSSLETIVKYMKENLNLGSGKIAKILNRNISTVSSTYLKARKKMPSAFSSKESKFFIPLDTISDRKFSVLESIVMFLKNKGLGNNEIAKLLNRDSRTIWTVSSRAAKKGGKE